MPTDGKGQFEDTRLSRLIDVDAVAFELGVSKKHVRQLSQSGRMPRAVKLGRCVRWRRADIDQWILDGCPGSRRSKSEGRR